ncbi:MAG: OmpA family protein [Burkholderiales bacterium]|nr:OmpA family protein [Burkholderiales bacterium]
MNFQMNKKIVALIATVVTLTGCAGTAVTEKGTTEQPVWPKWDSVTFNNTKGTFPDLQSLSQVRTGMTKDQLYYLLGRPQYNDGWRPVEWNYLFHFNTPGQGTNDVTTCQYKVLFDKNTYARSFYWKAVDPVDGVCPPTAKKPKPTAKRYTLGADALFAFGRGNLVDLNAKGKEDLDRLAAQLKQFDQLNSVKITGHTDYLGSEAANLRLSEQRAQTVRQYLLSKGLPASKVMAVGMGESQPVTQCANTKNRTELIACLQPNRRVEVEVDGSGVVK